MNSTFENVGAESCLVIWIIDVYFHEKEILVERDYLKRDFVKQRHLQKAISRECSDFNPNFEH